MPPARLLTTPSFPSSNIGQPHLPIHDNTARHKTGFDHPYFLHSSRNFYLYFEDSGWMPHSKNTYSGKITESGPLSQKPFRHINGNQIRRTHPPQMYSIRDRPVLLVLLILHLKVSSFIHSDGQVVWQGNQSPTCHVSKRLEDFSATHDRVPEFHQTHLGPYTQCSVIA